MFDTLYSQIGAAVMVVVVAFAFLKGDEPERIGGGAYALGTLASILVQDDSRLYGLQWGMTIVDVIMLGVYVTLAWKSRRSWPVWAAAVAGRHDPCADGDRSPAAARRLPRGHQSRRLGHIAGAGDRRRPRLAGPPGAGARIGRSVR